MKLTMHVTQRRPLVDLIGEFAGEDAVYMRAPTYAYQIGEYTVTRGGDLLVPDDLEAGVLHELYEVLAGGGYHPKEPVFFTPPKSSTAEPENEEQPIQHEESANAADIETVPVDRADKNAGVNESAAGQEEPAHVVLSAELVAKLNNLRSSIIRTVNQGFDALLRTQGVANRRITSPTPRTIQPTVSGESATLSLTGDLGALRGTKPIYVRYGDEVSYVSSWKRAFAAVLGICNRQEKYHNALMAARNETAGRGRKVIADSPQGMLSPLRVDDDLYVETNFSTEALLKLLRDRILSKIGFEADSFTFEYRRPY